MFVVVIIKNNKLVYARARVRFISPISYTHCIAIYIYLMSYPCSCFWKVGELVAIKAVNTLRLISVFNYRLKALNALEDRVKGEQNKKNVRKENISSRNVREKLYSKKFIQTFIKAEVNHFTCVYVIRCHKSVTYFARPITFDVFFVSNIKWPILYVIKGNNCDILIILFCESSNNLIMQKVLHRFVKYDLLHQLISILLNFWIFGCLISTPL